MKTQTDQLIRLTVDQLRSHPQNIRRFYPADGIRELADSIAEHDGVIQPLIVTQATDAPGIYVVVDGNRRLRAGQLLNGHCPALECKVVDAEQSEQLLAMVTTNMLREEPDPISEALHYRLIMEQERVSIVEMSRRAGVSQARIQGRLRLLQLDAPIQDLIASGLLPSDPRVSQALLNIKDVTLRLRLAKRFAEDRPTTRAILAACERITERMTQTEQHQTRSAEAAVAHEPMVARAVDRAHLPMPAESAPSTWPAVRQAAKVMCESCDTHTQVLQRKHAEPAWLLITHSADTVCRRCNVKDVVGACAACPGVELLRQLMVSTDAARSAAHAQVVQ